jgi:hypothetical protein
VLLGVMRHEIGTHLHCREPFGERPPDRIAELTRLCIERKSTVWRSLFDLSSVGHQYESLIRVLRRLWGVRAPNNGEHGEGGKTDASPNRRSPLHTFHDAF